MADEDVLDKTLETAPTIDDILYLINDPVGTPGDRKIALSNILKFTSGLTEDATPTSDAVLAYLNDISGTPTVRKIGVPQLDNGVMLYDNTLGAAGSWDVSSISQDYDDLLIHCLLRSDDATTLDNALVYFNNDTTATNYFQGYFVNNNGVTLVGTQSASTLANIPGASSQAGDFAIVMLYIPGYARSHNKQASIEMGHRDAVDEARHGIYSLNWESTAAINRITIITDNDPTDEFVTGSWLRIIGIKYS